MNFTDRILRGDQDDILDFFLLKDPDSGEQKQDDIRGRIRKREPERCPWRYDVMHREITDVELFEIWENIIENIYDGEPDPGKAHFTRVIHERGNDVTKEEHRGGVDDGK